MLNLRFRTERALRESPVWREAEQKARAEVLEERQTAVKDYERKRAQLEAKQADLRAQREAMRQATIEAEKALDEARAAERRLWSESMGLAHEASTSEARFSRQMAATADPRIRALHRAALAAHRAAQAEGTAGERELKIARRCEELGLEALDAETLEAELARGCKAIGIDLEALGDEDDDDGPIAA